MNVRPSHKVNVDLKAMIGGGSFLQSAQAVLEQQSRLYGHPVQRAQDALLVRKMLFEIAGLPDGRPMEPHLQAAFDLADNAVSLLYAQKPEAVSAIIAETIASLATASAVIAMEEHGKRPSSLFGVDASGLSSRPAATVARTPSDTLADEIRAAASADFGQSQDAANA